MRVLVLAPVGRDGPLTRDLLAQAGIHAECCPDLRALCCLLHEGAGTVVATEEAIARPDLGLLVQELRSQPAWSDVPLIVLLGDRASEAAVRQLTSVLGAQAYLTLLGRPMRLWTIISTVQSALRARRRQYEVRDHIEQQRQAQEALRRSEERYRGLTTASSEVLYRMSPD